MTVYIVVDANGQEWARYAYLAMANAVAARCDVDPALVDRAPFTVSSLED